MSNKPMTKEVKVQGMITVLFLLLPIVGWAQPGPPPDPDVPITGIEFLLGGGAALGLKSLISRFKAKK